MKTHVGRHPHAAALAAYLALAAVATWPVVGRFGTALAGQGGAPWRALWGIWSWSDSIGRGASPLSCDALRWPGACSGWLDLPATVAVLPVWQLVPAVPEMAIYNAALLLGHALAAFTMYLLCREIWGGHLAPFLSGVLYGVGIYHLGEGPGDPHVLSMAWAPLYFLALLRTVRHHGVAAPLMAGLALAAAALSSPYQLAFCCIGTVALLVSWLRSDRAGILSGAFLRRFALLAAVFVALAGWLYAWMWRTHLAAPGAAGEANASRSADLLAFFVPGASSIWRGGSAAAGGAHAWAAYLGWVALALALVAVVLARAARPWLALAAVGFVLALGPRLHAGGHTIEAVLLPYGWIERLVPALRLGADPARFAWLARFGVAVAAGATLSLLVRRGRRGSMAATVLVALALVESWPRPMPMASWPSPRFLRDLARDGERWAVLDTTHPARRLWNQVLHQHPRIGGPGAADAPESPFAVAPALKPVVAGETVAEARRAAVDALQQLNVRFVLADASTLGVARSLRLASAYEGDGLVVFEVPPPIQMASSAPPR